MYIVLFIYERILILFDWKVELFLDSNEKYISLKKVQISP